jgi:hypothetical protein
LKADDPIDLSFINVEEPSSALPQSSQVLLDNANVRNDGDNTKDVEMRSRDEDALMLEKTGMLP